MQKCCSLELVTPEAQACPDLSLHELGQVVDALDP